MIENPEKKNDVELAERFERHRHEITDERLDAAPENLASRVEGAPSRQLLRTPMSRLVRRRKRLTCFPGTSPISHVPDHVGRPDVVVERHHSRRHELFGGEREIPIVGADIENGTSGQVGQGEGIPLPSPRTDRVSSRRDNAGSQLE